MKPRSDIRSSRSCSCTSCLYKSESERSSLKHFVAQGSRIDKLYVGKYLPLREEKLLKKLIRTRAVYDDIRTTLLSDHNDSDTANLKPARHMPLRNRSEKRDGREYDENERSSVLLELVSLIDRGAHLPHRLSECCSCCVCGGSTIDRRTQRVHKHKHGPLSSLSSMTSGYRGRDHHHHRASRHTYKAKNIQSDPCTCTSKICTDDECDIQALMRDIKNRPKPVFEQYEGTTLEKKEDKRQKVKGFKIRPSGISESLKRFKKSKDSIITDTKNKLRDQIKRRTKRYPHSEVRASLRHKKSKEEEEEEVQEAIEQIKQESLMQLKENKKKLKEAKMLRNVDKGRGPYEGERTQYTVEKEEQDKKETRNTGEKVIATPKSVTAVQTRKNKVDTKSGTPNKKTKKINESNIQSISDEFGRSLNTQEKSSTILKKESVKSMTSQPGVPKKKDKLVTQHLKEPAKKNFGSGGYALKRCFCTLKLKPKINKTRRKGQTRSNQTETSKTQSSATSILQRIERQGVKYTTTPSNTRKLKQSTKSTSKNLTNVTSGLLPFECEPGVCVPGECDPIECDKLIKKRDSSYTPLQRIERHGVNYTTTPSNTRKLKQSTKSTSKNLTNVTSGLLPYECEPGVCVPGECDPIECDKLIKQRDSSYSPLQRTDRRGVNYTTTPSNTSTLLKRHMLSTSSLLEKKSRGSLTSSVLEKMSRGNSQTAVVKTDEEWAKEKHVKKKNIPVHTRGSEATETESEIHPKDERKVGTQNLMAERPSQISIVTKSQYSLTKHQLKRCFCTLKFTKKAKIQATRNSKGTLTSGLSVSDMKERPILRDKHTEIKEKRDINQYNLHKNECEPGICIPYECDPYHCLELIKKRNVTKSSRGSRAFKRNTKSTYSIAPKRLAKSRTIQSVSSLQKNRNVSRGHTASAPNQIASSPVQIASSSNQLASNPSTGNRQAVRIGSTFSFDIEFYKEKGDAKQVSNPNPETIKLKRGYDKGFQRRPKGHHKSTSKQTFTQDEGMITSSTKRCFCTLKLQKRAKKPATTSSTATETVMTKDMYPKVDIMVTRSTKMKRKDIQKLEPYECEPNFCVPGECDPYVCLKRIQTRDKVKSRDFGSGTNNQYKKSTASLTNPFISDSKNIFVKSDSGRVQKKRKRSKYTTSSSYSKVPVTPNISARQAVSIGSNFSFSIEFFKDRTFDMPEEPIIVGSNKKIREADRGHNTGKIRESDRGHNSYKTSVSNIKTQSVVKKANKGSWIQPILKRCFCTLKLQKNNQNNSTNAKSFNPVVMAAQIFNDNLQKSDKNQLQYISMKQSFGGGKSICYRSNMLTSSIETVSDIWFNSNKSIISSDMAYNMEKTLRHRSKDIINKENIGGFTPIIRSPFVKKSICAMNLHGIQRRSHKLEPYECEPGVCIPGECDPYECQKLIMKRFTKRSSTMTANGSRSQSTSSSRRQTKTSEQQYGRSRKRKEKPKKVPQVISYKLPPAKSRKNAVRIGSAFSFDVEFFKDRKSASPQKIYHSPVSRDNIRKRKGQSVGSSPYGRKLHDRGLRGSQVSYDSRPSQSGYMTQNKGVSIVPKSKRCFCTLQLKKRGKMQVQVGHEAKPIRVPYVDATQNTKKYNLSHLDPNECEPGVCVPGMCDPYECLERIKRRRYDSKDFGAGTKSHSVSCSSMVCEKMKCPQGKCVQIGEKKRRQRAVSKPQKQTDSVYRTKPQKQTESFVRGSSATGRRQAVKLGSSFSFNVEFYKDKTAQRAVKYVEPEPATYYSKPKRKKHYNQGTKQTTSSITRAIQDYPGLRHQDAQAYGPETRARGTKTGAFLKRCFCTAQLFKKHNVTTDNRPSFMQRCFCTLKSLTSRRPHERPPPKIFSDASNQTLSFKEKPRKLPKLEPYECEPGVCIPGECDPIVCAERIKRRNRAAKLSATDFEETRSTSTPSRLFRSTKSIGSYARERKEKRPKEKKVAIKYKKPTPVKYIQPLPIKLSSEQPIDRNAVKIGSNFSFNIEFYKIKYPAIQRAAREVKERRVRRSSTSSQLSHGKLKNRGVGKRGRFQNRRSQGGTSRGERGTGMLKRCFCTLALQADGKDTMTQGTESPYYKTYPKVDEKNTLTKPYKLLPYECEPGVCVPGECDPYECLKRIQRRREYGTSTHKRGTSSTSTFMRQRQKGKDRNIQSRRERQEKVHKIQKQPLQISEPQRQHRQAVKLGSAFSFNVEFSKSKTGSEEHVMREPEPEIVRVREPRMAKYRTTSSTSRPEKRMSTMSTSPSNYFRDTDSQAIRNMRSALTETGPFLKRCFCTLQFKNIDKNRRRIQDKVRNFGRPSIESECNPEECINEAKRGKPIHVYTATVNSKFNDSIDLNTKSKSPVKKRSSRRRNYQQAFFYNDSSYVYRTLISNKGPFSTRNARSKVGELLTGWNVEPLLQGCPLKLEKNRRKQGLKPQKLETPNANPGQCDPDACYERIKERKMRDTGTNGVYKNLKSTSNLAYNRRTQLKKSQYSPKETYHRKPPRSNTRKPNDITKTQKRTSNVTDYQDHHACSVGSNLSFNIEFYKNCSPQTYNNDSKSYNTQRKRTYSRRNTITNTSPSNNRGIATNIGKVRDKCMQAKCVRRDISLSVKPLLQRCFCTLTLQKKNKINTQHAEIKPQTENKSVVANLKHRIGVLLDPNECEPGVCVPGQCDPYECLERIRKRNLVNRSTDAPLCNKVCQQTSAAFVPVSKTKKIQYKGSPTRDSAIVETPRVPFIQPEYWNGVKFGSNIKCSVEFYKDFCIRPDAQEKIPINTKMAGDGNFNEPRYAQKHNQSYKPMSKCNKGVCPKRADGTMQTRFNTEDKSSFVGKALKRCFCTAKLQNRGRITNRNNVVVGRVDKLVTNSPFHPNKFEVYRMQKTKACIEDSVCNDMETILPYAPNKYNKAKSKTSLHRKGILKKNKCKCCEKVCDDKCIEKIGFANELTAKQEKVTLGNPNPVKRFFCRATARPCYGPCQRGDPENIKPPEGQIEESPKPKPLPLCQDCMQSLKNKKKIKKGKRPAQNIPSPVVENDIPCKDCKKNKICKCLFCKCPFCKYNVKKKAKDVTCRTCKKHLKARDYPLICAHCGIDFTKEDDIIQPAAKSSKQSSNKLNSDIKSSKNKTNTSKGTVNKTDKECADTCTGLKKKKIKKEREENNCSDACKGKKRGKSKGKKTKKVKGKNDTKSKSALPPSVPLPISVPRPPQSSTCPDACISQVYGIKISKVGQYDIPENNQYKRKAPCVCGSRVCASHSFKERIIKEEPKPLEDCKCGSSVCKEELKKINELRAEEMKKKKSEEKASEPEKTEKQKKIDELKKKNDLLKTGTKQKKIDSKMKKKEGKAKQKEELKKKKKKAKKSKMQTLEKQKKKATVEKKKKKKLEKEKNKKKKAKIKAAKWKVEQQKMKERRKIYAKEDKLRRKKRKGIDDAMLKRAKRTAKHGDCALLTESVIDIGKLGCVTLGDLLRSAYRTVSDPRNTYYGLKTCYKDPALAYRHAKDAVVYSGVGSTCKRVRVRITAMQAWKALKDKIESYKITHTLFHIFDKKPPKFRKRRKLRVKEPQDFDCSPFMASLRKRPYVDIWFRCPWFYPHFLSILNIWKQFTDVLLFLLAVVVWSPLILCWEAARALMCCTMCTQ